MGYSNTMNIFALDHNPANCAYYHIDRHVVKMITEHMQMLNANAKFLSGDTSRIGFINHPCTIWLRSSRANLEWLNQLQINLNREWQRRYGHASNIRHRGFDLWNALYGRSNVRNLFPDVPQTNFAQAMPDECKKDDAIQAYRGYYMTHKRSFASWKNTPTPTWYT